MPSLSSLYCLNHAHHLPQTLSLSPCNVISLIPFHFKYIWTEVVTQVHQSLPTKYPRTLFLTPFLEWSPHMTCYVIVLFLSQLSSLLLLVMTSFSSSVADSTWLSMFLLFLFFLSLLFRRCFLYSMTIFYASSLFDMTEALALIFQVYLRHSSSFYCESLFLQFSSTSYSSWCIPVHSLTHGISSKLVQTLLAEKYLLRSSWYRVFCFPGFKYCMNSTV